MERVGDLSVGPIKINMKGREIETLMKRECDLFMSFVCDINKQFSNHQVHLDINNLEKFDDKFVCISQPSIFSKI